MSGRARKGFTDALRQRVKDALGYCHACGQSSLLSTREAADVIGVPHTNLWRFLSGKDPSAETIDALVVWLDKPRAAREREQSR